MYSMRHLWMAGSLAAAILTSVVTTAAAADSPNTWTEGELLAVLRADSPAADKAITCKRLAIYGTSEAVPYLSRLLPDPQLSSWSRIALEAIPGPAADEALRSATYSLEGNLLIGAINSIGVRRDASAVDLLKARLQDKNAEVASAAAVALGRIGNAAAAESLRRSLAGAPANVRSAIAEGLVLSAERSLAAGKSSEAVEIYDEVRKADVPKQRVIEATRGAILARNQDGIGLLVEQLRSKDEQLFQLALGTAREFPGGDVDKTLATELQSSAPERAALIVSAMADRPKTVVLPAVLKAAGEGPKAVRIAALGALGRVGDDSCLNSLLQSALESDADLSQAAKATLADLPGAKVDAQILAMLPNAQGKNYPLLIEVAGQRRIEGVAPVILKGLDSADPAVRGAALAALGETVSLKELPTLISQAVAPKHAEDAAAAQQALKAASVRMPDREACAAELAAALDRASTTATKGVLLNILGAVGGTKALTTIGAAAKSGDAELQDISSRLLGEWMTEDAAPVLLDLAKTADRYQIRALRGYIRIARQFVLPDPQRAEMCRLAMAASDQAAERKLVLDILKRYPTVETFKMAVKATEDPELKGDATQASLAIAQKLSGKGVDVRDQLSKLSLDKVKVEIVKAEYGAGATQKDVTAEVQKQAADTVLVSLANPTYSAAFGGDPAPGTPKLLKIQYRLNGKAGEATFAENTLIVLPTPK